MSEIKQTMMDRLSAIGGKAKVTKTLDTTPPPKKYARDGKAGWNTYHNQEVIAQIKLVCLEHGLTQQQFASEAINIMFAKYGKGQIA